MYTQQDRMCDLMAAEQQTLQMISRFGVPLGVGEETIAQVCDKCGIHCQTFLAIVNYSHGETAELHYPELDIPTILRYLTNAHTYFFEFSLPRLRAKLIEAINYADIDSKIPMLIIRFFDEYVNEISIHMQHENELVFPYVEGLINGTKSDSYSIEQFTSQHRAVDDQHIASKLAELKNLILKYYPQTAQSNLMVSALVDIYTTEQDLAMHCAIEDDILLPAVRNLERSVNTKPVRKQLPKTQEALSDREKDVLVEVVNGLSNKEIADKLFISVHTVITHRKNIARKLNIHSTAGLTIYAIVNKLINVEKFDQLI